ncbi:MAG: hypothetical protein ACRCWO_12055 [Bosea sp. (in: a-proteobacteria)]
MLPAKRRQDIAPAALFMALAQLLTACAETGDLGRPRNSVWNNVILPTTGYATAHLPREEISTFHLTDDEIRLRDRAYRFTAPPEGARGLLNGYLVPGQGHDSTAYFAGLMREFGRSQVPSYRRLSDDASADRELIMPLRTVAGRVASMDEVRLRAARLSPEISRERSREADIRAGENREVIERVRERLRYRSAAYRYALDNLVVEVPSREAIHAERALLALEAEQRLLDRIPVPQPTQCDSCENIPGSIAGKNFVSGKSRQIESSTPAAGARVFSPPVTAKH